MSFDPAVTRHPAAAAELAEFGDHLTGALIALDFDGTMAPLVADPSASRPVDGLLATLIRLAEAGVQVAVVTGRDALTAVALGGLDAVPDIVVSGLHGAERWQAGQLRTQIEPPGIATLRSELPAALVQVDPAIWLEDKRLSLVVHTRQAADPDAALAQLEPLVRQRAGAVGLEAHRGKLILEIRLPDINKGDAIGELLNPETAAVLFAGDDLGDVPAVRRVRSWAVASGRPAVTIAVGGVEELREETTIALQSPAELASLLAELTAR